MSSYGLQVGSKKILKLGGDGKMQSYDKLAGAFIDKIRKQDNHILYRFCASPYFGQFMEMMRLLYDCDGFNTKSKLTRFTRQLQLNGKYDLAQYLEGVSEIIFQYFAQRYHMIFELDKKVNCNNGTDVDIQILYNNFCYNIEIKTPRFVNIQDDGSILNVNLSHRTMEKESLEEQKRVIEEEIIEQVLNNDSSPFKTIRYTKLEDNKLISFLRNAQEKFIYSNDTSVNILVIALPSSKMQDYWSYLYNTYSGVFTTNYDEKLIGIEKCEFDKIDLILLTNLVSGHIHPVDNYNSWFLENYCNIICINMNSHRCQNVSSPKCYGNLLDIIPNCTASFYKLYEQYEKYGGAIGQDLMACIFSEFLANNYKWLWWNS